MDSVSHIRVAKLVMSYIEQSYGISFDAGGFLYGNLKPDLTGTYFKKRHYPSLMMDEVMDKIRAFAEHYTIGATNDRDLSVDLGEICHFMTDFFTFPHNDDIYHKNLLAHYLYEKRVALVIRRRMTEARFEKWVSPIIAPTTVDGLIQTIGEMHEQYRTSQRRHCINDDLIHICRATTLLVMAMINIVYEQSPQQQPVLA